VSLALFGAFTVRADITVVDILNPWVFSGLLYGAMMPYAFSALTMKSVGEAANDMVKECMEQFPKIISGECKPDYTRCITISTEASLREMVWPGVLVIGSPLAAGIIFGRNCTAGLLAGALVSGVQLAISMSNTGGAWDNSKKYTEKGELNGYFPFRDGDKSFDEKTFRAAAENNHGNDNLKQKFNYGSTSGTDRTDIKSYLEDMKSKDKAKYEAIMAGEEGVETTDGRKVIYAGKKSNVHSAAVVGDTVGDPLKDTSGPALNIVMKLMAIISVVFADFFMSTNHGNGLFCAGDLPGGCFN